MPENPKEKSYRHPWLKRLFLIAACGLLLLLVVLATILLPEQIRNIPPTDPMAFFTALEAPVAKNESPQDFSAIPLDQAPLNDQKVNELTARHAALWAIRRSAFLPISDLSKVPPELRDKAQAWNAETEDLITSLSAIIKFQASKEGEASLTYELILTRISEPSLIMKLLWKKGGIYTQYRSFFPEKSNYLNPKAQAVWLDAILRADALSNYKEKFRSQLIQFRYNQEGKSIIVKTSDPFSSNVTTDISELPEDLKRTIDEWNETVGGITQRLVELAQTGDKRPLKKLVKDWNTLENEYRRALATFGPRFVGDPEFILIPKGSGSWFECKSRAELALYAAHGHWIRAGWICNDRLRDRDQMAYYFKKAGLKGRWELLGETLETKAQELERRFSSYFR